MAHKHLTYLDIPAARRRATASKTIAQLKESLGNPILSEEQKSTLAERIDRVNKWASGTLPSTSHVVEVRESVEVHEGQG